MIPRIDARRTYLIARRDFLGYIKTWGFWISFLMPFVIFTLAIGASQLKINIEPMRYEAILDETGLYADPIKSFDQRSVVAKEWALIATTMQASGASQEDMQQMAVLHKEKGLQAVLDSQLPGIDVSTFEKLQSRNKFVDLPDTSIETAKELLTGARLLSVDGKDVELSALLHIYEGENGIAADYWSKNINNERLKKLSDHFFKELAKSQYLESGGLNSRELTLAQSMATKAVAYNPTKSAEDGQSGQAVSRDDKIPYLVAIIAAFFLWLTIFSGAYMLLTSMLEEKLNKLLEMMLSTTRLSEIMLGKLLGVAALTVTAMLPYIILAIGGTYILSFMSGMAVASAILSAITLKLVIFFFIFLVLGYIFYGALFIALGALSESMQDSQTLTTPIVLVLTGCLVVVVNAFRTPDSPILVFASWFPLSAPFAAIARIPQDPPWWELSLSAFFLFLMSMLVIWLAGRIFKYGVLSGAGVKGVTSWIKRVIFRRKA